MSIEVLDGRVAVVTGAASGIGRATAIELGRAGCRLALVDIEDTPAMVARHRVTRHVVDVADATAMAALAEEVIATHQAVHVLVNCAGVNVTARFGDEPIEDSEWLFRVNVWGTVVACKVFLPWLERADRAHIVNVSSLYGLVGVPKQASYCASKFAVRGFSEALRVELQRSGIGVSCVYPGGVATHIVRRARYTPAGDPCHRDAILRHDRLPSPERVARAIVRAIVTDRARVFSDAPTALVDLAARWLPGATHAVQRLLWPR